MRILHISCILQFTLFIVHSAVAAPAPVPAPPVRIAIADTAGAVRVYQYDIHLKGKLAATEGGVQALDLRSIFTNTVSTRSVDDGSATQVLECRDGKVVNGLTQETTELPGYGLCFTRTALGAVHALRSEDPRAALETLMNPQNLGGNLGFLYLLTDNLALPETPLTIGAGWKSAGDVEVTPEKTVTSDDGASPRTYAGLKAHVAVSYHYSCSKLVDGVRCYQLDCQPVITLPQQVAVLGAGDGLVTAATTLSFTGRVYLLLEAESGQLHKATFTGTLSMITVCQGGNNAGSSTGALAFDGAIRLAKP